MILRHFTLLALFTKETGSVFLHGRYRYHEHRPYKRKEWTALVQIGKKVSMVLPMPDGKVHLPLVTTSELRSFRRCKREHHYSYRMGYREIHKAGPLRFGTAIHKALEVWWSAATLGNIDLAMVAIDANGEIDDFERAKARAMMMAYHARWIDAEFEVLAVEKQFEAPLINPATGAKSQTYEIGGAIDAIVRMPNGDVFICEHKTSGVECGLDSPYWKRLRIDPQISTYFVGARALGYDIKGCLYDVLRKPAIRPKEIPLMDDDGVKIVLDAEGQRVRTKDGKKWRETGDTKLNYVAQTRPETPLEFEVRCLDAIAEDPERHLVRGEVFRLESDELDAAQDMWDQARELKEAEKATRFPRNPDACDRWGKMCVYFPVCTNVASLEDETLYRRTRGKHEELTE